jgi:hypothetical protein
MLSLALWEPEEQRIHEGLPLAKLGSLAGSVVTILIPWPVTVSNVNGKYLK